eukprot:tig00001253_g7802.t1
MAFTTGVAVVRSTSSSPAAASTVSCSQVAGARASFFGAKLSSAAKSRRTFEFTASPRFSVVAHGPGGPPKGAHPHAALKKGEREGGFVQEMRAVAMRLHTKEQAPKEGEAPAKKESVPMSQWKPRKEDFLQFLVDSKVVYDAMESIIAQDDRPEFKPFRNTGIERSEALAKDIAWFASQGISAPAPNEAGKAYAALLTDLAKNDPPAFICHFYNVYFAHTAGGRMIGKMLCDSLLDGRTLEFYKWEGEVTDLLAAVKEKLEAVADGWSREQKDHCLAETQKSFQYSGGLMAALARPAAA